jgi:hypothetical protein
MSRIRPARLLIPAVAAAVVAFTWFAPSAVAGGPPRENSFVFEIAYLGCVDDVVDEPGVDGRGLVRVALTNESLEDVVVDNGGWRVVAGGETVAQDDFPGPANLPIDGTWEQVVQIPGDTGPAAFSASVEVTGALGTSTFVFDPLDVPGDCPQPGDATTTTEPTPSATDAARATPRLTG